MNHNVIIIGGGYAGLRLASVLHETAKVTIIDRNDYFHHKAAALRGLVMDGWEDRIYVDFDRIGLDAAFVQAEVLRVDRDVKTVTLTDGTSLPYDDLVIATGSTTQLPTEQLGSSGKGARTGIGALSQDYRKAKKVIVVGDGPVGVEMAGEFRDLSPDIEITIVSSAAAPMTTVGNAKFSTKVAALLKRQRITRIGGQVVDHLGEDHVVLSDGTRLEADVVVQAVGITPNTGWIADFAPHWLDARGQVKVGPDLRVMGEDHVHALGDCSDIAEPKMLKMADTQAKYLGGAFKVRRNGETPAPYDRFSKKLTILPFGAKDGVALLPIGQEGTVVWRPLGRFLVVKRKGTQLLSNMFPGGYATE